MPAFFPSPCGSHVYLIREDPYVIIIKKQSSCVDWASKWLSEHNLENAQEAEGYLVCATLLDMLLVESSNVLDSQAAEACASRMHVFEKATVNIKGLDALKTQRKRVQEQFAAGDALTRLRSNAIPDCDQAVHRELRRLRTAEGGSAGAGRS